MQSSLTEVTKLFLISLSFALFWPTTTTASEIDVNDILGGEWEVTFEPWDDESETSQLPNAIINNYEDAPGKYYFLDKDSGILEAAILGTRWETIKDKNTLTSPRIYNPFTIAECLTKDDEHLQLDLVNSDVGYQLQLFFANSDDNLQLEVAQFTQEAYFAYTLNTTTILMRDPKYYYYFSYGHDGSTSILILDTLKGRLINEYDCVDNSTSDRRPTLFNQLVPEHLKFKPMTDELENILSERFKSQ